MGRDTAGDTAWQFHLPGLARMLGAGMVDGVGAVLCLPSQPVLAAASLRTQTVAAFDELLSRHDALGGTQRIASIGMPARGRVSGLGVVDGGRELLATTQRGVAVIALGSFADTHLLPLLRPRTLGGARIALATGPGAVAVVPTRHGVDILRLGS